MRDMHRSAETTHSDAPVISIVMPTLNAARYLDFSIESLKLQSYGSYELIVVDGGSTDQTLRILEQSGILPIKIIRQLSTTLPGALNEGFAAACGDILCWLNADDLYSRPDSLSIIANCFLSQGKRESFFAYGNTLIVDENNLITNLLSSHPATSKYERSLGGLNLCTSSLFFSRFLYRCCDGGFNEDLRLGFEYPFIDHLFSQGDPVFVPCYLSAYRIHDEQLSSRSAATMKRESAIFDSHLAPVSLKGKVTWLFKRLLSRALMSNPLHKSMLVGKNVLSLLRAT